MGTVGIAACSGEAAGTGCVTDCNGETPGAAGVGAIRSECGGAGWRCTATGAADALLRLFALARPDPKRPPLSLSSSSLSQRPPPLFSFPKRSVPPPPSPNRFVLAVLGLFGADSASGGGEGARSCELLAAAPAPPVGPACGVGLRSLCVRITSLLSAPSTGSACGAGPESL